MRTTTLCLMLVSFSACSGDDASGEPADGTTTIDTTSTEPNPATDTAETTSLDETTTTEGADATSSDGDPDSSGSTGNEDTLEPADLVGTFASEGCEAYPDGNGGTNYMLRTFTLTETTWNLELELFMDRACTTGLFTAVIDGPYVLGEPAAVDGATEGEFGVTSNLWTAHQDFMAQLFTDSGCGSVPWVVGEAQDVTMTGCIGVAKPIDTCPQEYDIVALQGDALYFGERITDMCVPEGRPSALAAYPVVRQ